MPYDYFIVFIIASMYLFTCQRQQEDTLVPQFPVCVNLSIGYMKAILITYIPLICITVFLLSFQVYQL